MSVYAVGLTGGVACGKSLLAQLFEALNTTVVDADTIARQVVEPGPVLNCIVARFGSKILRADGCLDRRFCGNVYLPMWPNERRWRLLSIR